MIFSGCNTTGYDYIIDYYELLNTSMPAVTELEITGKGAGAYKTTTGIIDNTIYEGFGVLDTLYSTWTIPKTIDYNKSTFVVFKFFVDSEEIDKTMNLSFSYTVYNGNKMVNETTISFATGDINVSENQYEYFEYRLLMDPTILQECTENNCVVSGSIQRVASTDDYSGDINLISMNAEYYDFRPTVETSSVTIYNETYITQNITNIYNGTGNYSGNYTGHWYGNESDITANATYVHIGDYRMYDNGTDFIFEVTP